MAGPRHLAPPRHGGLGCPAGGFAPGSGRRPRGKCPQHAASARATTSDSGQHHHGELGDCEPEGAVTSNPPQRLPGRPGLVAQAPQCFGRREPGPGSHGRWNPPGGGGRELESGEPSGGPAPKARLWMRKRARLRVGSRAQAECGRVRRSSSLCICYFTMRCLASSVRVHEALVELSHLRDDCADLVFLKQ
jgi:hypothetical protein